MWTGLRSDRQHEERAILSECFRIQVNAGGDGGLITNQHMQGGFHLLFLLLSTIHFILNITLHNQSDNPRMHLCNTNTQHHRSNMQRFYVFCSLL